MGKDSVSQPDTFPSQCPWGTGNGAPHDIFACKGHIQPLCFQDLLTKTARKVGCKWGAQPVSVVAASPVY